MEKALVYILAVALDAEDSGSVADIVTNAEGYGYVEILDVDLLPKGMHTVTKQDMLQSLKKVR